MARCRPQPEGPGGVRGLRLCRSSVTMPMHRSAPLFAPETPKTPRRDPRDFHLGLLSPAYFTRPLTLQAERRFGPNLQPGVTDGFLAGTTVAVLASFPGRDRGPDLTETGLYGGAIGLGHLLLPDGVHTRQSTDGRTELDRFRTFGERLQSRLQTQALFEQVLIEFFQLIRCEFCCGHDFSQSVGDSERRFPDVRKNIRRRNFRTL